MNFTIIKVVALLILSNLFMTYAWYGHLKHLNKPLYIVIVTSWTIAFFEYCAQVPANRIGYGELSAAGLKAIQEIVSLSIFVLFSYFYLGEPVSPRQLFGFALMAASGYLIFHKG